MLLKFSDRLKAAMKLRDCSVEELALGSKLQRRQVRSYIDGLREPQHQTMLNMSKVLNVPVKWLSGQSKLDISELENSRYDYAKRLIDNLNTTGLVYIIEHLEEIDNMYKRGVANGK